ncbi:uncharacterized protein LOC143178272 [Calliopsis andreniformis]|uniref:uncharacterized protein LOC143178272 n=1 Tax=Calliopsis andreniformis TaxID=337506 RepID=UPI003FCD5D70
MLRISNSVTEEVAASFYLQHHAVTKQDSTTTRLRVVFDSSAKSSTGISLNDTQKVGPTVQSDLTRILLRFRTYRCVLSADVEKMYLPILIEPSQRRFQRILWRPNPNLSLETFELNTVTYGTASAPFLATRVLKEIGLRSQSESPAILESKEKRLSVDHESKVLGLHWSSVKDELYFKITPSTHKRITKRSILSEMSQIFDPLGLVGPVITRAKLIMQQLWQTKTGWDESVSQELCTQWTEYRKELSYLMKLEIPRCAFDAANKIVLHGFADASERAHGACVYLRSNTGAEKAISGRDMFAKNNRQPTASR